MVLGDGPLRPELTALIERLGLGGQVKMPGHVTNPLKYFARADAFVLSSHVEGLPECTGRSNDVRRLAGLHRLPDGTTRSSAGGTFRVSGWGRDPSALAAGIERALDSPIPQADLAEAVRPFEERTVLRRHFELLGLTAVEDENSPSLAPEIGARSIQGG